ncbi:MAG TPA: hypothetical protein VGD29_11475 [Actinoplanes sp.]
MTVSCAQIVSAHTKDGTAHRLIPSEGGTRIVYRTEITGNVPDGLGPAITADFPDVLAKLAAFA